MKNGGNLANDSPPTRRSHKLRYLPPVIACGIVILCFYVIMRSTGFRQCVCNEIGQAANRNDYYKQASRIIITCFGVFLEANQGAVAALSGLLVALFTGTLWWATKRLQDASVQQGDDMQRSIAEAARAALAMENVANHFADNVATFRDQMRAYVGVNIGGGVYQERARDLKFAGRPAMLNYGATPAYKVRYRIRADILPVPLRDDFDFPLPEEWQGGAPLQPHQSFDMNGVANDFVDDSDVLDIKRARNGRGLCVWGVITYEDVSGKSHYTKFSQIITWFSWHDQYTGREEERVYGFFTPQHNEAT